MKRDRVRELTIRIRDLWSTAEHFGMSHDAILRRQRELIWDSPDFKRLTIRDQSYIRGYETAVWDEYSRKLLWELYSVPYGRWIGSGDIEHEDWRQTFGVDIDARMNRCARADTRAYGIGELYASNMSLPGRHVWPNGRVFSGDSVVEKGWLPS